MESGKRKRPAVDRDGEGNRAATEEEEEEEVEEFVAILRRMREVSRCRGRIAPVEGRKEVEIWRPEFTWEDFKDGNSTKHNGRISPPAVAEREVVNSISKSIDLNAEPE